MLFLFFLFSLFTLNSSFARQAVCIVPIADLCITPIEENNLADSTQEAYSLIPISWGKKAEDQKVCPRGHQLLFNEVVSIIEEKDPEVLIDIPNIAYEKLRDTQSRTSYWILKKNLLELDQFPQEFKDLFPAPLSKEKTIYENVVTLKLPFFDPNTQKTYSAGTRFAIADHIDDIFVVYLYDTELQKMSFTKIPEEYCFISKAESNQDMIKNFIGILKLWTQQGTIPLVWGGSSFTHYVKDSDYYEKFMITPANITYGYWERLTETERPFAGFDASGLIYRAAQICGLPLYYRNTYTIAKYLRPMAQNEDIEEGDLVKVPGGMFIISDIKENKLITALGYSGNYGCILELALPQFLSGIENYDQLVAAYHAQQNINTLRPDGSIWNENMPFTILKLSSIWDVKN